MTHSFQKGLATLLKTCPKQHWKAGQKTVFQTGTQRLHVSNLMVCALGRETSEADHLWSKIGSPHLQLDHGPFANQNHPPDLQLYQDGPE